MQQPRPKVFGIGFHKTATKSLAAALSQLGYRVTGPNGAREPGIAASALDIALSLVPKYDAFQDNPWPILFRELDAHVPGSKFILTTRSVDKWYDSAVRFFGASVTPMRQWIYGDHAGSPVGNEAIYKARYLAHHEAVMAHFKARAGDLLVMDITRGEGWDLLCPFLGFHVPNRPFPKANEGARKPTVNRAG